MSGRKLIRLASAAAVGAAIAAGPAGALVRLGVGGAAGFALPVAAFDNDAKTAPVGAVRLYGNLFHWLTADVGADYHLSHGAESDTGIGETRLVSYRAGLSYKIYMGVFKPYLAAGWALYDERVKREDAWEDITASGFYVGPGLEYYLSERFLTWGTLEYDRIFAGARDGRDSQFIRLNFGVAYFYW